MYIDDNGNMCIILSINILLTMIIILIIITAAPKGYARITCLFLSDMISGTLIATIDYNCCYHYYRYYYYHRYYNCYLGVYHLLLLSSLLLDRYYDYHRHYHMLSLLSLLLSSSQTGSGQNGASAEGPRIH